jgi:outer membrane protein TolC
LEPLDLQPASRTSPLVGTQKSVKLKKQSRAVLTGGILRLLAGLLVLSGCTSNSYRRSADKEVYRIIQQYEKKIFGHTNAFTIDTAYSARKPEAIPPSELIEDRLQAGQRGLTIGEALDLAVRNSRDYQSAKETLYLTTLSLTGARYAFSPQFFANSTGTLGRDVEGDTFGNVNSQVGVSQFLKTGGQLSAKLANDMFRYFTGDPRRSLVSIVTVNLSQPLLRGFGRNNPTVEVLTQAQRNVVYAVRNYSFFQNQFAMEVVNDYFVLLAQKDTIRNRYTNYLGRVQSTRRLEARAADREQLADVDQARQAELTAKNNYVNAVAAYRNSLDQFKIKLGLPVGEKLALDDQELDEMEQKGLVPATLDPDAAYRVATAKQLQILNAIDEFEDAKRKVRVAANQLLADLNIVGDAALTSEPPTDYSHFNPDHLRADIGLELNLPLDRLPERNLYRRALVQFEAQLRALTLTFDNLKESIDKGLRTLEQRRQNYEIQKNALALANRRVESTTLLLEAGRAEVRDLVDAQDAQISTENAVVAAMVDYQQTRLQLMLDIGALDTEQPKFWLKDQLVAYLPAPTSAPATPSPTPSGEQPVLPPEDYFRQ